MNGTRECSMPDCTRVSRTRGLCKRHYYEAQDAGSLDSFHDPTRAPLAERFYRNLKVMPSGCVEWQLSRPSGLYGQIKFEGKMLKTHRVAWELANGPIPEGLMVCHTCDNPPCCNPAHLFLGSASDNMQDMVSKGRKPDHNGPKTHCPRGHEYTEANTRINPRGSRVCRRCSVLNTNRQRAEKRARRDESTD